MEQNKGNATTSEETMQGKVREESTKEIKKSGDDNQQPNFATEIFHAFKVQSRIATIGLLIVLAIGIFVYFANDEKWRDLFSSYDFVSQDGEGINSINTGEQGDLINGSEGEITEK